MKKILSLLLSLVLAFSLTAPAFAAGTNAPIPPANVAEVQANGNFTDITQLDAATYYVQKTDDYTIAIGLYDSLIDCSIYYHNTGTLKSAVLSRADTSSVLHSNTANFELIKAAILKDALPLKQSSARSTLAPTPDASVTSVSASDKSKIMTQLYNAGWPQAYTNYLRASKTENGVTAKLYHTLSYSIVDHDYTFVVAKTALSVLLTLTGLPASTLKLIVTLALTADGVYQTVKDITLGKDDVYAYETKSVRINDIQPYWAGRTVKWTAIVGDIGATLTFEYENKHNDFYDNDGLLSTGLRNYANGM